MVERVPFTDIYLDETMVDRAKSVLESGRFVKGPEVEALESAFAELCEAEHAVAVSSGTDALLLAMRAVGVEAGDGVLVPAHTFFATVSPALFLGAVPTFVDVDEETYTMDTDDLRTKLESAEDPAAIVPVHLYGQPADMDEIKAIASEYDVAVIEDACQAHAAKYGDERAGAIGDIGCFSFYPSKNMTVAGDGGIVTTGDDDLAADVRQYRNHGRDDEDVHQRLGLNHRLDEINGAIGHEQVQYVEEWGRKRNEVAAMYEEHLADISQVTTPIERDDRDHVYHLYVVRVPNRESFRAYLNDHGIDTGIHYPTPVHRHPATESQFGDADVPVTERIVDEIVSLPMHPRMDNEEVEYVCDTIRAHYQ
jgi:dTDP-4-amino-4,6-dideoxygalactose transaminase